MKSIVLLVPYFGSWPEWFDLFLLSCKWNKSVDWLFFTDCEIPVYQPPNVRYVQTTFPDYCVRVSDCLKINFAPQNAYKICDLKPFYGLVHKEDIVGYDYFGFCDIDIIFGNLRNFLTGSVLQHNLISSHQNRISGHFCLLKNTEKMHKAFYRINGWEAMLENPEHLGIDESKFTRVVLRHRKHPMFLRKLAGVFDSYQRNNYWKEQHSTILSPKPWHDGSSDHPQEWQWQEGCLTNSRDGDREFMYLHFMNWKSSRWLPKKLRKKGVKAAWDGLERLVTISTQEAENGFRIDKNGFSRIYK